MAPKTHERSSTPHVAYRFAGVALIGLSLASFWGPAASAIRGALRETSASESIPNDEESPLPERVDEQLEAPLGEVDFGYIYANEIREARLSWENSSDDVVEVYKVGSECGCVSVVGYTAAAPPGAALEMQVKFDPGISSARKVNKRVHILTEGGQFLWGRVRAIVINPASFEPGIHRVVLEPWETEWVVNAPFVSPPHEDPGIKLVSSHEGVDVQFDAGDREEHRATTQVRLAGRMEANSAGQDLRLVFQRTSDGAEHQLQIEFRRPALAWTSPAQFIVEAGRSAELDLYCQTLGEASDWPDNWRWLSIEGSQIDSDAQVVRAPEVGHLRLHLSAEEPIPEQVLELTWNSGASCRVPVRHVRMSAAQAVDPLDTR